MPCVLNVEPVHENPEELFERNQSGRDIRLGKMRMPNSGGRAEVQMWVDDRPRSEPARDPTETAPPGAGRALSSPGGPPVVRVSTSASATIARTLRGGGHGPMAGPRDRRAKPDESRRFTPEEAEECSALLRRRIAEIQDPTLRSARHDDPRIEALESSIRATVRDIFGDVSHEAGEFGAFRFARQRIARTSNFLHGTDNRDAIRADMQRQIQENLPGTVTRLEGLIQRIAERTVAVRESDPSTTLASPPTSEASFSSTGTTRKSNRPWPGSLSDCAFRRSSCTSKQT